MKVPSSASSAKSGTGRKPAQASVGSPTENVAMERSCGSLPVSGSTATPFPVVYDIRKAWREGLEVALKVKGSQGRARREWVKVEPPWTAISAESEVHANHCEAPGAALRRRLRAFRRRQNLYAKTPSGLDRALSVQRLIHNWVRPRWSSSQTPAMEIGFASRAVSVGQMLSMRSFRDLPP